MAKDTSLQIPEAQQTPSGINLKKSMPRHIVIKLPKTKNREKLWKAAREGKPLCTQKHCFGDYRFLIRKHEDGGSGTIFFQCLTKRTVNLKFYMQ